MGTYTLRVVTADDYDVPAESAVSERVLAAVDAIFGEICRNIVSGELRLQGEVPEALYADAGIFDDRDLSADARRMMDGTLDYLGGGTHGTWMDDTFPDVIGRRSVASAVLDIHSDLEGNVLLHGPDDDVAAFSDINLVRVTEMAGVLTRAYNGGIMGIIVKDPKRRGHYAITSGNGLIPLIYVPTVPSYDREDFAAAGPVIAMGTVVRDEENRIIELRAVENCYTFPVAVFQRGISSEGHEGLVYPLEGIPSYYARTATWYLKCDELGLESSAKSWDECVIGFHRRFVSLWASYEDGTLDNPKIRDILDMMRPPETCPCIPDRGPAAICRALI